jgi:cytochrome c oxidase subunit I
MHLVGVGGMMRRISDPTRYNFLQPLQPLNVFISICAFLLLVGQIPFVINFFWSLVAGRRADANPWQANTLEWSTSSPPPQHNFEATLIVHRGPYDYSVPDRPDDWLPQDRLLLSRTSSTS